MRGREARGGPATGLPSASWSRPEPRSPRRSRLAWCFRASLVGSSWQVRPFVAGTPEWPGGSGRTQSFRAYPGRSSWQVRPFLTGTPRRPGGSGRTWSFRAYLVGSSWQVRPFVAGTPGWPVGFGCTETFRVYPVIPGVPGVFGRTWSEVRGRYARLWQVLRGRRVVPGVPGVSGRTWSEVRGRYPGAPGPELRQRVRGALVEARTTSCGTMSIGRSSSPSLGSSRSTQRRPSSAKSTCTVVSGGQKCFASGMSS